MAAEHQSGFLHTMVCCPSYFLRKIHQRLDFLDLEVATWRLSLVISRQARPSSPNFMLTNLQADAVTAGVIPTNVASVLTSGACNNY